MLWKVADVSLWVLKRENGVCKEKLTCLARSGVVLVGGFVNLLSASGISGVV